MKAITRLLPARMKSSHKASAGRCLLIAGSPGYFGAAILAARAAARAGAGYVQVHTYSKEFPTYKNPDFLVSNIERERLSKLHFDAVAIGPGLGQNKVSKKLLRELVKLKTQKVVVDADALNVLTKNKTKVPSSWILTPHEGEMGRLIKRGSDWVRNNRTGAVKEAQKNFGCIVVLKGHESLIYDGKNLYKNKSGNAALAKAGTGDVLTGIITAFLAQGLEPFDAAKLGAYVHGRLADEWIKKKDELSLMASDLIEMLPATLKRLRSRS